MRRLYCVILLAAAAACDLSRGTAPDATTIQVQLRNDAGTSAGRNQVIVSSATSRTLAVTRGDGTVAVRVTGPGSYSVRVVPREGFVWAATLQKTIIIDDRATAVVVFTLFRTGGATDPQPTEG